MDTKLLNKQEILKNYNSKKKQQITHCFFYIHILHGHKTTE